MEIRVVSSGIRLGLSGAVNKGPGFGIDVAG